MTGEDAAAAPLNYRTKGAGMWQQLKRVVWSIFHPAITRRMRRSWQAHMSEIRHYDRLKGDFRLTKRQSGPRTLQRKRKKIKESGRRVVDTCGAWLEHSTELPWVP